MIWIISNSYKGYQEVVLLSFDIIVILVGLCASLSSIVFSYLAFKRSEKQEHKIDARSEGIMVSDIGYIKACVDLVEKSINKVDERYRNIAERLAKQEEALLNLTKRVDDLYKKKSS